MTWSAADHHWPELHRLLPNHKEYLGKKVVKSLDEVQDRENLSQYIDKKTDYVLRNKNINENSDIVNWFFLKMFALLVKYIFPVIEITDYIARREFQGRGAIHIHAIVCVDGDVTPEDLEMAIKSMKPPGNKNADNQIDETEYLENLHSARVKVNNFASNHVGLTAIHPNSDLNEWPERLPNVTDNQCLREYFTEFYDSEDIVKKYETTVNILQRHKCTCSYCLVYEKRQKETNDPKCRFQFPKEAHGFTTCNDEENRIISITRMRSDDNNKEKDIKCKLQEDELVAPLGSSIVNGKITPIRNHPRIVQHIKEMPLIWGANTEAQIVTSHHQLLMYIVKYVMKAEKSSEAFNRISKEILQKEGELFLARKMYGKLLMNSIDRDKSRAECFLIAQQGKYVEYSQPYVSVNLNGSKQLKVKISSEDDEALESTDWLTKYEQRDENENYRKLCIDFEKRNENEN